MKKSTTGQGEEYTIRCLLDQDYTKIHYRFIAVDLSRKRELDVDSRGIQQVKLVVKLKNQSV